MILPPEAGPLLAAFAPHFTAPTHARFLTLAAAAVLTTGRRTVANLVRTLGRLAPGHDASYRRVLSAARWSGLELGCALAAYLLRHLVPDGPVYLVGDDTVDGHPGRRVYGKGRHRDPVRSSHAYTAWRYGHKWVVLAVLVKLPFATGGGPCRSWSTCTAPRRSAGPRASGTAPRPGSCAGSSDCCCSGSRAGPSCSPGTRGTGRTRWPGSATATGPGSPW